MIYIFTNYAETTLAEALGSSDIQITLTDSSAFPVPNTDYEIFYIYIEQGTKSEWITCNANATNVLDVEARSDSPQTFTAGATVKHIQYETVLNNNCYRGQHRIVYSDPNGTSPLYDGEEVLFSDSPERDGKYYLWYKHKTGTDWETLGTIYNEW